jgi:hypothetical protein
VNAAQEVADRLRAVAAKVESDAPRASVQALSRAGETMTKLTLSTGAHALGTPTPNPPGGPPGLISGALRRSVARTPAAPTGPATWSQALGSVIIYAAVQEFGAVIRAKNFPQLGNPTAGFFGPQVTIPPRPWMKISVERLIESGLGQKAAISGFEAVLDL